MSRSIVYDSQSPPSWFKYRNIKYHLRDSVMLNGEGASSYYGLIVEIRPADHQIKIQWYYLPHEMVLSKLEQASLHPNEIFFTQTTDWVEIETVQLKASIFHTKGFAPPKSIPTSILILRRKYDPYRNRIRSVDLEKDGLTGIEKLDMSHVADSDCSEASSGKSSRKSTSNTVSSSHTPLSTGPNSKYFFLSADDPLPETPLRNPKHPAEVSSTKRGRATTLTSELETMSLTPAPLDPVLTPPRPSLAPARTPAGPARALTPAAGPARTPAGPALTPARTPAAPARTPATPTITRSGRKVKPRQHYHSLQRSLAMEALMRSNLLNKEDSASDLEISFKENLSPNTPPLSTPLPRKKRAKKPLSSSEESSDSEYEVRSRKRPSNKTKRTPLAPRRAPLAPRKTPCVVPKRAGGGVGETSFSVARSRLHVAAVPDTLPCREDQFADIYYFIEGRLEEGSGGCMYISGVPGTGKTATVRDVLRHVQDGDHDYKVIQINGMKLSDPKQLYSHIYRELEGRNVTPDHGNLLLSQYFGKCEEKSIVLVVDELDLLWTRKQHVMYNLFDWPNRPNSKLVVIAIANTMDLPERMLMNKVASRLGLTRMTFQPYSHSQLLEIIMSRLEGTEAFAPEACILAARKVAAASGDARRALDICRHAIDVAEAEGAGVVTSLHIQRSITDMYQSVKTRAIMNCTLYQKMFLKSVLGVFRRKGVEEAVFKEVYEVFSSLCQFQGVFSPGCGALLQLCVELGGARILLVEQGPPSQHTHIRLNSSQDEVVFALKEST